MTRCDTLWHVVTRCDILWQRCADEFWGVRAMQATWRTSLLSCTRSFTAFRLGCHHCRSHLYIHCVTTTLVIVDHGGLFKLESFKVICIESWFAYSWSRNGLRRKQPNKSKQNAIGSAQAVVLTFRLSSELQTSFSMSIRLETFSWLQEVQTWMTWTRWIDIKLGPRVVWADCRAFEPLLDLSTLSFLEYIASPRASLTVS